MAIPLLSGRSFSGDDRAGAEPVAVVSKQLAEARWPGEDPLGRRIRVDVQGDSIWRTVVGVVGDVRYRLDFGPQSMFYVPFSQRPTTLQNWVVRTATDPSPVAASLRRLTETFDPDGSPSVRALTDAINSSTAVTASRFVVLLLGGLSALAATLAIVGVYGTLAYLVQIRSREIGIQLALGAGRTAVLKRVLVRGTWMAGLGIVLGVVGSLGMGRVIQSQLFGVRSWDPLTLSGVAGLLLISVLLASFLPAQRAASLDPVEVMRG
jgi:ABC-type antimicrobial peptide transport system permease subunit